VPLGEILQRSLPPTFFISPRIQFVIHCESTGRDSRRFPYPIPTKALNKTACIEIHLAYKAQGSTVLDARRLSLNGGKELKNHRFALFLYLATKMLASVVLFYYHLTAPPAGEQGNFPHLCREWLCYSVAICYRWCTQYFSLCTRYRNIEVLFSRCVREDPEAFSSLLA
jgi:hypothetical protein